MQKIFLAALLLTAGSLPAQAQEVTLGAVLPLSGASATIGGDQRRGIELAVEQVNADGGVLGGDLRVIVEDSGGRPPSALDAAKKLVTVDKVPVVLGEFSSGNTIPIGQYVTQEGRVHINFGSSSGLVRSLGEGSFSTIGLDNVSAKFAAEDVFANGWKTAAVIMPNNAFGQSSAAEFEKAFTALGGSVTTTILYTEGQTTYRRELQQMERSRPDVYVYTAYGREAATITREAAELGLNETPWYGAYLSMMFTDSDPRFMEGQAGFDVNYVGPDGAAYETLYREKYGEPFISAYNGYVYDGVMLVAEAINKAGSAEPAAIIKAIKEIGPTFEGVTGTINLDADGQRSTQPYARVKIEDGELKSR